MLDRGIVDADAALVSTCLDLGGGALPYLTGGGFRALRSVFFSARLVLARVAGITGGAGAGCTDLAALISAGCEAKLTPARVRWLVLLLLFYGARGPSSVLRKALRGGGENRYRTLMDDVLEVARWRRWIANGSIGGLPPELAQEIMFEG